LEAIDAVPERPPPTSDTYPAGEPSDCTLLSRFRKGEEDAATAIYLRYAKRLQLLARSQSGKDLLVRVDPEDVVQSVFRTFFRRAAEGYYVIPDGEELWKLFLVIALNKVRELGEFHRAAKRDVGHTTPLDRFDELANRLQTSDEQAYGVLRMTVDELLAELPEVQRRMVMLRIEGQGIDEIAQATQRAKRSVERVLQRFRARLGETLRDDEGAR
jgi:RNA polymerase sigma-70 factor, ECF subfamily